MAKVSERSGGNALSFPHLVDYTFPVTDYQVVISNDVFLHNVDNVIHIVENSNIRVENIAMSR